MTAHDLNTFSMSNTCVLAQLLAHISFCGSNTAGHSRPSPFIKRVSRMLPVGNASSKVVRRGALTGKDYVLNVSVYDWVGRGPQAGHQKATGITLRSEIG